MLTEKRFAPRFETCLSAKISIDGEKECDARIQNISLSGIQMSVCMADMPELLPNIHRQSTIDTVPLNLVIRLPKPFKDVDLKCGVIYIKRNSMHECTVGCRFEEFANEASSRLSEYIYFLTSQSSFEAEYAYL